MSVLYLTLSSLSEFLIAAPEEWPHIHWNQVTHSQLSSSECGILTIHTFLCLSVMSQSFIILVVLLIQKSVLVLSESMDKAVSLLYYDYSWHCPSFQSPIRWLVYLWRTAQTLFRCEWCNCHLLMKSFTVIELVRIVEEVGILKSSGNSLFRQIV